LLAISRANKENVIMPGPFTYLDVGVVAIGLISGLLAMYRGLTREVLSIVSWALAGLAALYFVLFQKAVAQDLAAQFFSNSVPLAQIAIGSGIFLIVLIIVHLVTIRFSDSVLDSRIGMIDRLLGFLFGVARGLLLVVIMFMFFNFFVGEKNAPEWVMKAQTLSYLQSGGTTLQSMLSAYIPADLNLPGAGGSSTPPATEEAPAAAPATGGTSG
jgi:membrane protein required for colicin V production